MHVLSSVKRDDFCFRSSHAVALYQMRFTNFSVSYFGLSMPWLPWIESGLYPIFWSISCFMTPSLTLPTLPWPWDETQNKKCGFPRFTSNKNPRLPRPLTNQLRCDVVFCPHVAVAAQKKGEIMQAPAWGRGWGKLIFLWKITIF